MSKMVLEFREIQGCAARRMTLRRIRDPRSANGMIVPDDRFRKLLISNDLRICPDCPDTANASDFEKVRPTNEHFRARASEP